MIKSKCLYTTYTGLTESLGKSQVLNYVENINTESEIHIISFENDPSQSEIQSVEDRINSQMIEWHPLKRSPGPAMLSTFIDFVRGFFLVTWLHIWNKFDVIHARSYVPMGFVFPLAVSVNTSVVFDIRGFWIDERVDRGSVTRGGPLYRLLKNIEKQLYSHTDVIITLTETSKQIIEDNFDIDSNDIYIIPTCVDTNKFTLPEDSSNNVFRLGYVGTVNEWHHFDEVLDCYGILSEQVDEVEFLIYNEGDEERINRKIEEFPKELENIQLTSAPYSSMPQRYADLDAGIFFYEPTYARKATCPTKMGEFLATGTPCLGNSGVGDVEEILEDHNVGVSISYFSEEEKREAVSELINIVEDPESTQRCRMVAQEKFSLESGVETLERIYSIS